MMDVHITLPPCRVCLLRRLLPFQSDDPSPRTRLSNKVRGCRQAPTGKNELAVASTALRVTPRPRSSDRAGPPAGSPHPTRPTRPDTLTHKSGFFLEARKNHEI